MKIGETVCKHLNNPIDCNECRKERNDRTTRKTRKDGEAVEGDARGEGSPVWRR